jgi:hypothetical protein
MSHSWLAIVEAIAQQPTKVQIRSVVLDVFHTHDTVESLGLRECFSSAFQSVTVVCLRGQYRFWDSIMTLACFPSVTHLTVEDCTLQLATLKRFFVDRRQNLEYVLLKEVALLPYPQLGFVNQQGTYLQMAAWLASLPGQVPV